jgi:uncharacterized protein (TIGR02452 family)
MSKITFTKPERVKIQNDTIEAFTKLSYKNQKNETINIPQKVIDDSIKSTEKYDSKSISHNYRLMANNYISDGAKGQVLIYNSDCLEAGLLFKSYGYDPLVLNMASYSRPGGGYENGAAAQEENMFRRTNLFQCLNRKMYPIGMYDGIYTKGAVVIKDSEQKGYAYLDNYQTIDFMAFPAYKCKEEDYIRDKDNYPWLNARVEGIMQKKIDNMCKLGVGIGNDVLILSAVGGGAYGCPPWAVSNIMKDVIEKNNYTKYYKYIVISIIEDRNSQELWDLGNLHYYCETFKLKPLLYNDVKTMLDKVKKETIVDSDSESSGSDSEVEINNKITKDVEKKPEIKKMSLAEIIKQKDFNFFDAYNK